ncbi:interferon-induced protein 44-like isoform X1 [Ictalurus punctatus]|uniref:Interferon-induced protein 44-like isoform X1 n=2 Tax=Ictalurus punctatus TaxID=7998 RepID=A0A2D0RSB1_ICTPU|nr:interferon-induced protein 44-like isoform X1 [Ictalurus punctatus]
MSNSSLYSPFSEFYMDTCDMGFPSIFIEEQEQICSLLGNVELHLLYKASVHGYTASAFHQRCDHQGPTVIVAYSNTGDIFGGYTSEDYTQTQGYINDKNAFLFQLQGKTPVQFKIKTPNGSKARNDNYNTGPCFGNEVYFLHNNSAKVCCNPGNVYKFKTNDPFGHNNFHHSNQVYMLNECAVFKVTNVPKIAAQASNSVQKPWRNVLWTAEKRAELMQSIKNYKPPISSVKGIRVLLIGPIGAGKSSFFNSINSVFRGHVTSQAMSGSSGTSVTNQFRTYTVKAGREGNALPLILCDTMGLEECSGAGLNIDDISSIIKGYILDRYKFNPASPFQPDERLDFKPVTLQDKIHCVAYVLDTGKVSLLSSKVEAKLTAIRQRVNSLGIPQIVLLTKVDEACPDVGKDLQNIYFSAVIKTKFQEASNRLGVPMSNIIPVKNYSHELDLDLNCDILLLTAVQQMFRFADNYFDDISPV